MATLDDAGRATVWLAPSAFAPHIGGIEHAVSRLGRGLRERGHRVVVVTHRYPATLPLRDSVDGLDVHRVLFPSPAASVAGLTRGVRALLPALRALRAVSPVPDVVHVHGVSNQLPVLSAYCALRRVPLVITTHGEVAADDHDIFATSSYLRLALRVGARQATALTVVAEPAREAAGAIAPRFAHARVIGNGVDTDEWPRSGPPDEPVFGAWGRHEHAKGFDVLRDAFDRVRVEIPAARLLLGGDGSVPVPGGENIDLLGRLTRPEVGELLGRSRVVVVPSRKEAFGLVALEAMAAGRTVVWSDLPGLRAATGGLGFPAAPGDSGALAEAMIAAVRRPADPEVLRAHAATQSWDAVVQEYVSCYPGGAAVKVLRVYHAGRDATHRERDRALVAAGVDLTLIVPSSWPGEDSLTDEGFDVVELEVTRPGDVNRHRYAEPRRVADLVARVAPDVVDLHEEPFSSAVHQLLQVLPSTLGTVAYTAQNIDKRFPPPFAQWERSALTRLGGLYPCSRQAASVVVGKGFTGPVEVLPLAPSAAFTPGVAGQPDGPVRLLLVGRLVPEKGVLDAVRAAGILTPAWPVELTLVGAGPEEGPARGLAAQLGVRLQVLPWLAAPDLAEVYRRSHVLLAPSRATATWAEQFGRMVVEAQACGTAVVGYASGALPEVIGDAGVVVGLGDADSLAGAVAALLSDPDRRQRLRAAGLAAAPTWDSVAQAQIRLYERALRPHAHLPVRPGRATARARFGDVADTAAGRRPFALPVLRDTPRISRPLAAVADLIGRHDAHAPRSDDARLSVVFVDHVARMSGGEVALVRLIQSLDRVDAHVVLGEDGPLRAALESAGATVEVLELDSATRDLRRAELGGVAAVASTAGYVARLSRRLRELGPDLVHTNSLKAGYYGSLAGRLARVPVIWHLRDRISDDYLPAPAVRLTRGLLATLPDVVVCNSAETRGTAGARARTVVVHDPYAPTRSPRAVRPDLRTIGVVGRLAQWKGQDVVLRAAELVHRSGNPVAVRVIGSALFGEDNYVDSLHALVDELGVAGSVTFTGQVEDVEGQLAELDVLVHASRVPEPFGQVVVEGMAAGLPVVATAAGGPAEIITPGVDGLLVPADDPHALAEALRGLAPVATRARLAAAATSRAADFAPSVVGPQMRDVYAQVAARR